jgi:hypothetical protein
VKNLLTTLLFFLLIKIVAAQSVSTTNDSIKPLDNSTTGTWLKIMYSTKGAPFTAKEIIYIKGNSIIIYNGKVMKLISLPKNHHCHDYQLHHRYWIEQNLP